MNGRRTRVVVLLVALALAIAGAVTWFVLGRPQPPAEVSDAGTEVADAGPPAGAPVDISAGDALAKGLVPDAWLAGGDAVRRAAAAVYAVSKGQSPRVMVPFLDPGGTFTVDEMLAKGAKPVPTSHKRRGAPKKGLPRKYFISEKNDARYDEVTKVFTSIDAAAVGRAYGQLRPYLDAAFKEIAPPGQTFDAAFTAAVDRLASVPITDGPREVVPMAQGIGYAWADPKLEALSPAEKHLLRMGPKNARAVVKQLQAFKAAMEPAK